MLKVFFFLGGGGGVSMHQPSYGPSLFLQNLIHSICILGPQYNLNLPKKTMSLICHLWCSVSFFFLFGIGCFQYLTSSWKILTFTTGNLSLVCCMVQINLSWSKCYQSMQIIFAILRYSKKGLVHVSSFSTKFFFSSVWLIFPCVRTLTGEIGFSTAAIVCFSQPSTEWQLFPQSSQWDSGSAGLALNQRLSPLRGKWKL